MFWRLLIELIHNWRAIISFVGLVVATGFCLKYAVREAMDSILNHYEIFVLICATLLMREIVKGIFSIKSKRGNQT